MSRWLSPVDKCAKIALTTTINMFQVHNSFRFGNKEMKDDKKCEGSIETPKECVKSIQT